MSSRLWSLRSGVYRNSYKNARRLAATEANTAYRTADHLRWQQMDFVVGQRVVLSNNHTLNGKRFRDICDDLSAPQGSTATRGRGCYPKDFKFTGWHPLCRCHAESILKTPEELKADTQRILDGKPVDGKSVNSVDDVPKEFKTWLKDNKGRIERAKSMPYFIRDNFRDGNPDKGYVWQDYVYRVGEGRVVVHHLVNPKDSDYKKLIQIAEFFASRGAAVELTPKMTRPPKFEYKDVYGSLVGTKYEGKCPDLKVDGLWYEHEGYETNNPKRAFRNMLNDGLKQSDRLIIDEPDLTDAYMKRVLYQRIKDGHTISEIWLRGNKNLRLLFKKSEE